MKYFSLIYYVIIIFVQFLKDKYLTSRLIIELKQALMHSEQYLDRIKEFCDIVTKVRNK